MEDTKEKILEEWNTAWSSPPFSKMEIAKNMQFNDIDDLYRRLLGIAKNNGNPTIGQLKKKLRDNYQKQRPSGNLLGGVSVGEQAVYVIHWSKENERNISFKITSDFLLRIRKWKKLKRSTS